MALRRLIFEWLLIGVGASVIVLLSLYWKASERADNLIYDSIAPLYAPPPDDRIMIVNIDNQSLAQIGRWPWSRTIHARAITQMKASQPSAILYDILFVEPTAQDPVLAQAMRGKPPVLLPVLFDAPGINGAPFDMYRPVAPIAKAVGGVGTANLILDSDGQARRIDIATPTPTGLMPHLAELAYRQVRDHPSPAFARASAHMAPVLVPFNPTGSFRTIDFRSVLHGEVAPAFLTNKILLVGVSAPGLGDTHPVSAASGGIMPGIEIQANLLNALLADRFITTLGDKWVMVLSVLPLWLLLIAFWCLRPSSNLQLSLVLIALVLITDAALLMLGGIWLPPVMALVGIIVVYPLWGWRRLAAISQFLVSEVDRMMAQPNLPALPPPSRWAGDRIAGDANRLHQVIGMIHSTAQEREEMLQFLSHDMRAPQAAIIALAEDPNDMGSREERFERIRTYARHTLKLADDFVQLARLHSRREASDPIDLTDAMAQAADIVWPHARTRKVVVQRVGDATEVWIEGDSAALVRAFTNLLDNAVRHAPPGSSVNYEVQHDGALARCRVSDRGPGLAHERRDAPFERFGASGSGQQGSGLGLAFVRAVARRHGGDVHYTEPDGGGACFTIELPLGAD